MRRSELGPLARRWELFLALRYLRARRKQAFTSVVSVVSVLGIAVGVSALVIALALLTGFQQDIQAKILGATAHITIFGPGAQPMAEYREVVETVAAIPGVAAVGPSVMQPGLLQGEFDSRFATLKGVARGAVGGTGTTDLLDRVVEGDPGGLWEDDEDDDRSAPPGVVLGADLADGLFVTVGDTVRFLTASNTLTPLGSTSVSSQVFRVVGIFEAGMYEYDNTWALVALEEAQGVAEVGDTASYIEVTLDDFRATEPVMEGIRERLDDAYPVQDWKQMNEFFFAALNLEKLAMFVTISLIVFVAALNIVATLVLMVMEKHRDIGILLSMGAKRRAILYTFMAQGLAIGLTGTAVGLGLGIGISWLMDRYQLISLPQEVYYLSHVPFIVRPVDFIAIALLAVAISFVATLYPAWRASRLDPVEALRYE